MFIIADIESFNTDEMVIGQDTDNSSSNNLVEKPLENSSRKSADNDLRKKLLEAVERNSITNNNASFGKHNDYTNIRKFIQSTSPASPSDLVNQAYNVKTAPPVAAVIDLSENGGNVLTTAQMPDYIYRNNTTPSSQQDLTHFQIAGKLLKIYNITI